MKTLKTIALSLFITTCISATAVAQKAKKIDVKKSKIEWVGKKLTSSHSGTLDFKEGNLVINGKKVVGGQFVVDMTTINTTDIQGKGKEKLDAHLKNDDFFGVEKFPTASLSFKSIGYTDNPDVYIITADLTIKDITNPVEFELKTNSKGASAKVVVDRTLYDIKYASSGMGVIADKAISDEFELNVALLF